VLQDTGWSAHYPTGKGLFAFRRMEEAVAGIEAVNADYAGHLAPAARRVAEECFERAQVLGRMLKL